jgi:hypothetical protein
MRILIVLAWALISLRSARQQPDPGNVQCIDAELASSSGSSAGEAASSELFFTR